MKPTEYDNLPLRPCVGIMVLNHDNRVWVGKRKIEDKGEMSGATQLWQMPQGGIDEGEEPLAAAKRELWEETGIKTVSLIEEAPDWIDYELPGHLVGVALKGRYRGQTQRWFAFRFEGDDSEISINPPPGDEKAEFDEWAWKEMDELVDLIVPFKREVYEKVVAAFGHLKG